MKKYINIAHTLSFNIKRYYTDVDGLVVAKGTVPAALQTKYPVYLLAQFDRSGGYPRFQSIVPPYPGTQFLMTYVHGVQLPFLQFSGNNTIQNFLQIGDIVLVYTDNKSAPTYFIFIVISGKSVSLASIVNNTESTQADGKIGSLYTNFINYGVDNQLQYREPIHIINCDNVGNIRSKSLQPSVFVTPMTVQPNIDLEINFKIDQYIGLGLYMQYTTDEIEFNMNASQI